MPPLGVLDWQTIQVGFGAGLFTKTDKRFSSPPSLDIARDIQFEELGGVQARLPFAAMSNTIFGGGTLTHCRRLAVLNGELVVFTDTAVFSWNAQLAQWVSRGTHLAVSLTETTRFATTGDQIDGDRAELSGTVVFAWVEGAQVYAAAYDKTTGSVLVSPTAVSTAIGRPRLVPLATTIMFFVEASATLLTVRAIDPAAPATAINGAGTTVLNTNYNLYYDVVRAGTQDLVVGACRRVTTTSYETFLVTPGLSVTNSTKGRTCDGPIAVSTIPDGTKLHVIRANTTNIQCDIITTSGLVDTAFIGVTVGSVGSTPVNQIAACHRSVQDSGAFRCYAFWDSQESTSSTTWISQSNWVDSGGSSGSPVTFLRYIGVASRAFDYNGSVYVWMAFGGASTVNSTGAFAVPPVALQNSYFLYRDDASLVAKTIAGAGGGLSPSTGRLPGVVLTSGSTGYSWCAAQRRRIALISDARNFAARQPVDATFTFDSNTARRSVQIGATLYIAAGEILTYDGVRIVELGHHVYPWVISLIDAAAGGSVAPGTYAYKATFRYQNAQGEVDRSTTATIGEVTVTGNSVSFPNPSSNPQLTVTHKIAVPPAIEIWRTQVTPTSDAPFYLATSNDPTALTNPNRYIPNDPTVLAMPTFNDFFSDATLATKEINPENSGVLEALVAPAATIIIATDTRLFLAGVAGDPDRVWYSRERNDGEVASFNDALVIDVPPSGGAITSIWVLDGVLYAGRQYAIYALPGVGFDNTGGGQNYGPAQIVSGDVGPVSQEAQCQTPLGLVFFSAKGWYLMDRSRALRYIGAAVNAFDSDTVLAMNVMTSRHEVRVLTNNRLLTWTYTDAVDLVDAQTPGGMGQWSERTISDGLDALLWNGGYVYLTSTGPKQEQASYSGLTYAIDVETSWIKLHDLQGYGKTSEIMVLGEYRSAHLLRIRLARDYQYDGAGNVVYFDDRAWTPSPTTVGSALQVRHSPSASNGNCEALKVRITAVAESVRASLITNTALSPTVTTSGAAWAATWAAASSFPGLMGNALTMSIAFVSGSTASIDVRDHLAYSVSLGRWIEDLNNVGVLVTGSNSSTTVSQLEAAISAGSKLCALSAGDVRYPTSAGAMATACGGLGTWAAGWLCEDAASPLTGAFGGTNLAETASGGSPVYQVAGPLGDKAVRVTVANTGWAAASTAFLDADSTKDICGVAVVRTLLPLSQTTTILSKTDFVGGPGFELTISSSSVTFTVDHTTPGNVTAAATVTHALASGEWFVVMFALDRAAVTMRVAIQSLSSGAQSVGASQGLGSLGSVSNAGAAFRVARGGGLGNTLDCAAVYMGVGVGAAAGLPANLASALTAFTSQISGTIAISTMAAGAAATGSFSGGAYTSPSGEACKLTGIALRVGVKPGLYNRLPAAQKQ